MCGVKISPDGSRLPSPQMLPSCLQGKNSSVLCWGWQHRLQHQSSSDCFRCLLMGQSAGCAASIYAAFNTCRWGTAQPPVQAASDGRWWCGAQGVRPQCLGKVTSQELAEFIAVCIQPKEQRPRSRHLLKHPYFNSVREKRARACAEVLQTAACQVCDRCPLWLLTPRAAHRLLSQVALETIPASFTVPASHPIADLISFAMVCGGRQSWLALQHVNVCRPRQTKCSLH